MIGSYEIHGLGILIKAKRMLFIEKINNCITFFSNKKKKIKLRFNHVKK